MATTPPQSPQNVNIGIATSISQEELSSTASMSAGSIHSDISNISTDSEPHSPPNSAYKSAMDLTNPSSNDNNSRHVEEITHVQQGSSSSSTADEENTGGNTQRNESEGMPRREELNENASIRSMLLEFSNKIESSQRILGESMKDEMREMKDRFRDALTPIKDSIDEANRKIDTIERDHIAKINANTGQIVDTNTKLQNAEIRIQQLQQQISAYKPSNSINPGMLARMNNIVISGIKEDRDEDLKSKLNELASDLNCELSNFKARRLGKVKEGSNSKPRQILLELSSNWEKRKMHAARSKLKNHENTSLQSVYFNEDLDKNSSELYYKARMAKKQKMIKSVWTYGCQVYFTKSGSEQPILLTDSRQLPLPTSGNVSRNINDSTGLSTTSSSGSLRSSISPRDGGTPGGQAESMTSQSRN